jgi:hypothetical protein
MIFFRPKGKEISASTRAMEETGPAPGSVPFPQLQKTLWQLLGPSILFVALSLNGGELLLWPSLVANFSLKILWPIPIILVLQFIVNTEIERYALTTGRSTEESLVGSIRWLAVVFAFTVAATLIWPAWMSTAGNLAAELILPPTATDEIARNVGLIITICFLLLVVIVFRSRQSYKVIETISKVGLIVALGTIAITVSLNFRLDILWEGLVGLFSWGYVPVDLPRFDFLGALAFGGVAGVLNLVQSEWILDKKYGVAQLPQELQDKVELETVGSRARFREWFRTVNKEHFVLFFCANIFSIFLLAYLGRLLLPLGSAQGFSVLVAEISALNAHIPFLGVAFGAAAALIFIMANVAILDAVGRLTFRMLRPFRFANNKLVTPSNISTAGALAGVVILFFSLVIPSLKQPYFLLVLSASLSAMVMWLYPPLLLKLNLRLPAAARPGIVRVILILVCTIFYGWVSLWALSTLLPSWLLAIIAVVITGYQIYYVTRKS